jgi:Glycosyl transferases group 1
MKVIVTHLEALGRYVSREFYYVITELMETYGWGQIDTGYLWASAASVGETLRREFGELPKAVLFWEGYDFLQRRGDEVQRLDCRKYIFADDLHWWRDEMRPGRLVGFALCEAVLSTYAYRWDDFYPEFCGTKRLVWVPHSASPDFMLGYNRRPENAVLLSGAVSSCYPLREQLRRLYERGTYAINCQPHPGYHRAYDYERDGQVGRRYAETIRRHRAAFTDGLVYGYVVAKHFEIPATGALLVADEALGGRLGELGFVAHEHYLPASAESLEERIRYVLDECNHAEVDEIRRRGQRLVRARHTTAERARRIDEACRV